MGLLDKIKDAFDGDDEDELVTTDGNEADAIYDPKTSIIDATPEGLADGGTAADDQIAANPDHDHAAGPVGDGYASDQVGADPEYDRAADPVGDEVTGTDQGYVDRGYVDEGSVDQGLGNDGYVDQIERPDEHVDRRPE